MKVVFMGTPDFAVPSLKALAENHYEIAAVYTQPDKPKGRGYALSMPPVKEAALSLGIPVFQPVKVKDDAVIKDLRNLKPDVIVVAAFGQILPEGILNLPEYGCINVHASLLPRHRGAAPIQWVIIDGDKEAGVTTMLMDAGLDTGDMLLKEAIPVEPDETGGSLHDKLSILGAKLLIKTLTALKEGTCKQIPQAPPDGLYDKSTKQRKSGGYAGMLTKETGNIDWSLSAGEIDRLIRALNPWPGAYTFYNGKMLKIWKASLAENNNNNNETKPGSIVSYGKQHMYIKTGNGLLALEELQLEGKKRMHVSDFLRGATLGTDTAFSRTK